MPSPAPGLLVKGFFAGEGAPGKKVWEKDDGGGEVGSQQSTLFLFVLDAGK